MIRKDQGETISFDWYPNEAHQTTSYDLMITEMELSDKSNPTDTWLPGAKLAYDFRTKKSEFLISWKSKDDPAPGLFSLEVEPTKKQYICKWNGSEQYWTTGPWNGHSYENCGIYAFCGAFSTCSQSRLPFCSCLTGFQPKSETDWKESRLSGGCVRNTPLHCRKNTEKADFFIVKVTSLFTNSSMALRSAGACEGDLLNLLEDNVKGKTIYIKVASKDIPRFEKNRRFVVGTIVGSVVGGVFVLRLAVLIVYRKKWMLVCKTRMKGLLAVFIYRDLHTATKNFSNKHGEGGFGSVFKGVLSDSSIVAVKRLERLGQGEKQFRSEVSTIGPIQHVNLVRLRGFCAEGNSKLLVYDYMPNGSLQSHLFHEKQDSVLNWKTRYEIALGITKGLVYLHDKCRECIIHCDIKPENILLDADFGPKLLDFGLAKLVGRNFSRVFDGI
nr:G-type lectin S-receptor-like serine/threonine-protein kinase At2g19130 [Tanacetum cinerariifolium]